MHIREKLDSMVTRGFLTKEAADKIDRMRIDMWKDYLDKKCQDMEKVAVFGPTAQQMARELSPIIRKTTAKEMAKLRPKTFSAKGIAQLAGISALLGIGVKLAEKGADIVEGAYKAGLAGASYEKMYEEFPEFKGKEDQVKKVFGALKTYSPRMAQNPIVAGTFVKQQLGQRGMITPDVVSKITQVQQMADKMPGAASFSETLRTIPTAIGKGLGGIVTKPGL